MNDEDFQVLKILKAFPRITTKHALNIGYNYTFGYIDARMPPTSDSKKYQEWND